MEGPERNRSGFEYAAFWARSGIIATLGEQASPPVQQRWIRTPDHFSCHSRRHRHGAI